MSKNLVRISVAVLTTALVLLVLWQFRTVVAYVLLSLILAASIRPLFSRLAGKRLIMRLIWIFAYILAASILVFLFFLIFRESGSELQRLAKTVSVKDKWNFSLWADSSIQQSLISRLPSPSVLFQAIIGNNGELVIPALLGIAQGIGGVFAAIAIIFILSVYWGINQVHFERLWLSLLPSDQRTRARGIWRTIEPEIGKYIQGQLFQSLLAGVLFGVGYWLMGSPYPVLLALIGALACLVPVVGAVLALIPPLLVGLLTSVPLSMFLVLYTFIVLIAILIWVKPRLGNRRWNNPILTVILLIGLADAFGIIGILLAPPLSMVCQILWRRLVTHRVAAGASAQLSDLHERMSRLRETIVAMDDPRLPLVTSSMERISKLMAEAEPVLQINTPTEVTESPSLLKP
jgi:predicted PurR-regulated permease PerM